jgi:hypothetical protein
MKVERTERRVSRSYARVGLRGAKETDTGQIPEILESLC